jgi:hypothetical protein
LLVVAVLVIDNIIMAVVEQVDYYMPLHLQSLQEHIQSLLVAVEPLVMVVLLDKEVPLVMTVYLEYTLLHMVVDMVEHIQELQHQMVVVAVAVQLMVVHQVGQQVLDKVDLVLDFLFTVMVVVLVVKVVVAVAVAVQGLLVLQVQAIQVMADKEDLTILLAQQHTTQVAVVDRCSLVKLDLLVLVVLVVVVMDRLLKRKMVKQTLVVVLVDQNEILQQENKVQVTQVDLE